MKSTICILRSEYNLRSAYNAIERRMAPLSRELAGLILPHDKYGSHLDDSGHTTDTDHEKLNFKHAGHTH